MSYKLIFKFSFYHFLRKIKKTLKANIFRTSPSWVLFKLQPLLGEQAAARGLGAVAG